MFHVPTLLIVEERTLSLSIKNNMGLFVQFGLVEMKYYSSIMGWTYKNEKKIKAQNKFKKRNKDVGLKGGSCHVGGELGREEARLEGLELRRQSEEKQNANSERRGRWRRHCGVPFLPLPY